MGPAVTSNGGHAPMATRDKAAEKIAAWGRGAR